MKRFISVFFAVLMVLFCFASCKKADTSLWQANDTFKDIAVYEYGDTISADFAASCNIKIQDNNYDNFAKYIGDLKSAGFKYLKNGDIPENYSLSGGTASWRCTNGKVYLQLIFSEDGTQSKEAFGCNVQIYGYSELPDAWKQKK